MLNQLEDFNFADEIAILSTTSKHLQEKTNTLNIEAKQTGLNVNVPDMSCGTQK